MKLSLLKIFSSATLLVYLLLVAPLSHAADVSLVVSPPRYDLEARPGETIQKIIKITNNSQDQELILQAFPVDFIVQDDQGTPVKVTVSGSGRYLASPWFTLDQQKLIIPPKATTQVIVMIDIPSNALPGGHYSGVFFEPLLSRNQKSTISYTTTQIGTLFSLTIAGDIKYDALIKNFSVKTNISEFGPIAFQATIENQSDTHIKPLVSLTIADMFGRQLTDLELESVNIFPFTSRTISGIWDTVWGFGRYTATLTAAYGPGLVATRTLFFWILPYRLIAAVLVVILVILVLIIVIRRHLKHREDHRDEEIEELKHKIAEMENHRV